MKKIAYAAFASAAVLALAACGSSETPAVDATTDSVETLPEETLAADPMATDAMGSDMATDAAM